MHVAAENCNRRPSWLYRGQRRRRELFECVDRVNNLPISDSENRLDVSNIFVRHAKIIAGKDSEIRELTRRDAALDLFITAKPSAAHGEEA